MIVSKGYNQGGRICNHGKGCNIWRDSSGSEMGLFTQSNIYSALSQIWNSCVQGGRHKWGQMTFWIREFVRRLKFSEYRTVFKTLIFQIFSIDTLDLADWTVKSKD